jgi:hypothetical protein
MVPDMSRADASANAERRTKLALPLRNCSAYEARTSCMGGVSDGIWNVIQFASVPLVG